MATLERTTLSQAVAARRSAVRASVGPTFSYIPRGDYLSVFFTDVPYHAERIDDLLTVYRAMDGDMLVGCKIKGVSLIAENVTNMFKIEDEGMSLGLLLLNAAGPKRAAQFYYDVSKQAELLQFKIPVKAILKAAA